MDSRKYTELLNRRILKRFNSRCAYCGKSLCLDTMTRDHVIPLSKGGINHYANLFPSCRHCNSVKANITLDELGTRVRFNRNNKLISSQGGTATSFYFEQFI